VEPRTAKLSPAYIVATKFSGEMTGLKVAKLVGGSEEEARL
jgi:hypothetical protein